MPFLSLSIMTEVSIYFIPSFHAGHFSHPFHPNCFGRPDKIVLGKESMKSINTIRGTELVAEKSIIFSLEQATKFP